MQGLEGLRTLLLDASWRPVATIGWQRAMTLDLSDRVHVLEYYEVCVRTVSARYPLPAVVRARRLLEVRPRKVTLSRRNVFRRDRFRCQYCGEVLGGRDATIDHVVPRSRGGDMTWDNVVTACRDCNAHKAARTPREARMRLLATPLRPTRLAPMGLSVGGDVPEEWMDYLRVGRAS